MKQQSLFEHTPHSWIVHIDGASRNNPGKSGAGIYMQKDGEVVCTEGFYLGIKTNNQAEYLALLLALYLLQKYAQPGDVIRIASDSELLVKQMQGAYRVKHEGLQPLHNLARKLVQSMQITLMHVMRADNAMADELANKGVDSKKPVPDSFVTMLADHGISLA